MHRPEFLKLVGGKNEGADYIPVACLLRNGYACAGYINQSMNEQYSDICILVNARMVDLRDPNRRTERGAIHDFSDFLEEFVVEMMDKPLQDGDADDTTDHDPIQERFGKTIPLTAIVYNEIAVVYPVVRIGNLLRQVNAETKTNSNKVPSFLDFDRKSLVINVLRTKLW